MTNPTHPNYTNDTLSTIQHQQQYANKNIAFKKGYENYSSMDKYPQSYNDRNH